MYELGTVVQDHVNAERLAFITERSGGLQPFVVESRLSAGISALMSGLPNSRQMTDLGWLVAVRVIINGTWVGCFGEVDPAIASLYDLRFPNGAEFDVDARCQPFKTRFEAVVCADDLHSVHPLNWQRRSMPNRCPT